MSDSTKPDDARGSRTSLDGRATYLGHLQALRIASERSRERERAGTEGQPNENHTEAVRYDRAALVRWCAMMEKGDAEECWSWTGGQRGGYGSFGYRGQTVAAHRWGYEMLVGSIPADHHLHHTCENPLCVNPRHLVALTLVQHQGVTPEWSGHKTHCKRGHPLSGNNVRFNGAGSRICRSCERDRSRSRRIRRGAVR